MRLICPNCDAQYEVPDDVMPKAGRDVQCSNCGQTWFQNHPDFEPTAEEAAEDIPAPDEEVAPPPPPPPPPAKEPERKQLDPAVADILRQEAEAEQAARRSAPQGGLESQPDLGMDLEDSMPEAEADRRAREARERMARLRGNEDAQLKASTGAEEAAAAAALGSRRDLLPDIDEINSTLRSGSGRNGGAELEPEIEAPTHQRKRRGFRTGFLTVLLIFIVLAVLYIFAPRLAEAVPALEAPLQSYVMMVDNGRAWLDGKVQGILRSLDTAAEESNRSN
ncbi:zinc-ribbon domain-containing protein [Sulfitobacter sp. HNIBRBA2951]|uniref:zinc-ribbon domain-containing protein n=1 Tax=Sulfitobacter aquimarinus TaxID=3158557 RepID=UPI0032DE688E